MDEGDALCGVCSDGVQQEMKVVACDECQRWFHQACGKISNYMFNKINNAPQETHLLPGTAVNLNVKLNGLLIDTIKLLTIHMRGRYLLSLTRRNLIIRNSGNS